MPGTPTKGKRFGGSGAHQDDRHVHVTGHGHQGQHRLFAIHGGRVREQFHVVNRGAGTLGHARHRGGLCKVAVLFAQVDDPVGQHAAAFATHGQNSNLDWFDLHDKNLYGCA